MDVAVSFRYDHTMSRMIYLKSAVLPQDYPAADRPEIVITGRSNAGKSSFINCIAKAKVAHVSQQPGKTRLLNFFDFAKYRFVDTPGYGFASRSGDEMVNWTKMIESYLAMRENLCGLVLLMDIRREWDDEEKLLKQFCNTVGIPMAVALTKADKCKTSEKQNLTKKLAKASEVPVFAISAQENQGVTELEDYIYKEWVAEALRKSK